MHVDMLMPCALSKEILAAFFVGVEVDKLATIENITQRWMIVLICRLFEFGEETLSIKFLKEVASKGIESDLAPKCVSVISAIFIKLP